MKSEIGLKIKESSDSKLFRILTVVSDFFFVSRHAVSNVTPFFVFSYLSIFSWSSSGSSGSGGKLHHDITSKQGLTGLYNSGVVSVEHVTRPLGGPGGSVGIKHSGVVVTTGNGDRWLVHKGPGYGDSSK